MFIRRGCFVARLSFVVVFRGVVNCARFGFIFGYLDYWLKSILWGGFWICVLNKCFGDVEFWELLFRGFCGRLRRMNFWNGCEMCYWGFRLKYLFGYLWLDLSESRLGKVCGGFRRRFGVLGYWRFLGEEEEGSCEGKEVGFGVVGSFEGVWGW